MNLRYLGIKPNRGFAKPYGNNNELNQYFTFYAFIVNASSTLFTYLPRPGQCLEILKSEKEHPWKRILLLQS